MNAMSMHRATRKHPRDSFAWRLPLHHWSLLRTTIVGVALALIVFVLGARAWRVSDASQFELSRAGWSAAQAKAQDARRIAAELPALRARVASARTEPERWSAADALRASADLAAQSGLRVAQIEPATARSADPKAVEPFPERVLKLHAEGTFAEMRRFLEALAGLPRLIVPGDVRIRRQADALVIETALRVFETLPPAAVTTTAEIAARANAFVIDPFGNADAGLQGGDMLLVGTFVGRRRAMALLQSGRDVDGFAPGAKIGDEWLGRVVPRAVELARRDGASRKLTLVEDRP
ncbi:hypothetical protein AWB79_05894 [Caballeronia hypogeia]|uniref:Pilus assembly protein, PilO n=1 Tax=Caballeronia hypogeia TaxID=1777140 RepID=A0A158CS49_9BURK|nr:type 4a pilus biogenesis protein PilO [Caballeronia hypogeia]SAK85195.1 hypothetical protein AWB79_05894 [Caballeronia hypogeia]